MKNNDTCSLLLLLLLSSSSLLLLLRGAFFLRLPKILREEPLRPILPLCPARDQAHREAWDHGQAKGVTGQMVGRYPCRC